MYNEVNNHINDEMVKIPGGEIILRDDRIKHKWKVEIKPLLLAKFPVTQELYFEITQKSPSSIKGDQNPVEDVSWDEAVAFCNLLSQYMMKKYTVLIGFFAVEGSEAR